MEMLAYIITIPSLLFLIVSVFLCFNYIYFKKGNIKKSLLLLIVSLVLVASGIGLGIFSEINKPPYEYELSNENKAILETKSYEDATSIERQNIISQSFMPLSNESRAKYGDKFKEFYVKYYSDLRGLDENTISAEYDNILDSKLKE